MLVSASSMIGRAGGICREVVALKISLLVSGLGCRPSVDSLGTDPSPLAQSVPTCEARLARKERQWERFSPRRYFGTRACISLALSASSDCWRVPLRAR
jgi:hypothetical protein